MNIKKIIKESLLKEVGEASALPYKWRLKVFSDNSVAYRFKTRGGSDMLIEVNFVLIHPFLFDYLETNIDHPYYYWDTEFVVMGHKRNEYFCGDDKSMTISSSQYKTDKVEIFRIMSTISEIVKDFMKIRKVRGFAFRPASDSRGNLFVKYFERQLPDSEIINLEDGAKVITVNKSIKYVEGDGSYYDSYNRDYDYDEEPTFKEKLKSKFSKDQYDEWVYNTEKGRWERKGLLNKFRRKLGVDENNKRICRCFI